MANSKPTIFVLIIAAVIAFILFAIWPAIKGSDDNYGTKAVTETIVDVVDKTKEAATSAGDAVVEKTEQMKQQAEQAVDRVKDEVESKTEVVVEKVAEGKEQTEQAVESVKEAVVDTTESVIEQAEQVVVKTTEQAVEKIEDVKDAVPTLPTTTETTVPTSAGGEVHVVSAQGLKYAPLVIKIAVGDSVAWENMSSHDTQSIEGLIPEGAEAWHSAMGENFQHKFTVEGIYIYKCTPHYGAGMGGVVIVGNPVNLDQIKAAKIKGAGKRLVKKAIKAVEAG